MTRLEIGNEINQIAVTISNLVNAKTDNIPQLQLLIDNQCMKLQRMAEELGVFYVDID